MLFLGLSLAPLLDGCGDAGTRRPPPPDAAAAVRAVDDAGRAVRLPRPARRVVALLPAGTEMLFALGAGDRVVGRTRYDAGPEVAGLPSVGGGLDPSFERLVSLRPDLVVEFETAGGSPLRARLEGLGIAVYGIRTEDTTDVYRDLRGLGTMVGRARAADSLVAAIRGRLAEVRRASAAGPHPTVLYVASLDPPIVAGAESFVAQLLGVAGARPVPAEPLPGGAFPQLSLEEVLRRQPDVVMLPVGADAASSVARLRSAPGWRELGAVRAGRIAVVPADLTDRPGPRIAETARVMREAILRVEGRR